MGIYITYVYTTIIIYVFNIYLYICVFKNYLHVKR